MRSDTLEALSVNVDPAETKALQEEWERRGIDVPLKVLDSPYREITRPVIDYVKGLRREQPARRGHRLSSPSTWSATGTSTCCTTRARCGSRAGCCSRPGVMVTSVPYQLESSEAGEEAGPQAAGVERAGLGAARPGGAQRPKERQARRSS